MENIKVKHGTFVEKPKCLICQEPITHESLGGDYTLLLCSKEACNDAHTKDLRLGIKKNFVPYNGNGKRNYHTTNRR